MLFAAQAPNSLPLPNPNWSWNGPIELLNMDTNGSIAGIHEIMLNQGDFVEVDAEFDLVISSGHSKPLELVFLACKQLLRLSNATVGTVRIPFLQMSYC